MWISLNLSLKAHCQRCSKYVKGPTCVKGGHGLFTQLRQRFQCDCGLSCLYNDNSTSVAP